MPKNREDFTDVPYEACEPGLEQSVSEIMADVLDIDRVSRTDSFYDFAGTSLQAIRICARIESTLGLKALPLWLLSNDLLPEFVAELRTRTEQTSA
jgi:Phosphopantetheine attachment site